MSNLESIIIKTREKIQKHRENFQKNEQNVRSAIIDPILKSIGWDTGNLELVDANESNDLGFPDYTLKKRTEPVLIIEAKRMGVEIGRSEDLGQIGKYCMEKGVDFGVVTNGSKWILFKAFEKRTKLTDSILWKVDFEHDDPEIIISMLESISRTSKENIKDSSKKLQKKIKNQQSLVEDRHKLMEDTWKKTISDHDQIIKFFSLDFKTHANKSDLTKYKIGDPQISEFVKDKISHYFRETGETYPQIKRKSEKGSVNNINLTYLIIKGEKIKEITKANQILIETANWLIREGKLQRSNCQISVTKGIRYLINSEPVHKNKTQFLNEHTLSNGLFIETNSDRQNTLEYAKRLFEHFGYSRNDIQIE
jgi:predicted type IV restriction endonuclease